MLNMMILMDINMLFIVGVILARTLVDRRLHRNEMHYYTPMVVSYLGLTVSHLIFMVMMQRGYSSNTGSYQLIDVAQTFMHAFYYLLLFYFLKYILTYLRQSIYISQWCEYIAAAIGILYTILWSINSVNHMFVTVTDHGIVLGPYYALSQLGGYLIIAIVVAAMVYGFKAIGAKAFLVLLTFILFPLAQSIARHYLPIPPSLIESLGLSLVIIYSFIHFEQVRYYSNIANVLEMSKRNISILEENLNSFRKERHDIRFHMTALSGLLKNGDIEGAKDYLEKYTNSLSKVSGQFCQNAPLNAVLSYYFQKCEQSHIPVDISVDLEKEFFIDEIDFCVLVGNLFENAYEASLNYPDNAHIELRIKQTTDHIIAMKVSNQYDGNLKKDGSRYLSTKRNDGGIGLDSVREIAVRYNASVDIQTSNNVFEVKMVLTD